MRTAGNVNVSQQGRLHFYFSTSTANQAATPTVFLVGIEVKEALSDERLEWVEDVKRASQPLHPNSHLFFFLSSSIHLWGIGHITSENAISIDR